MASVSRNQRHKARMKRTNSLLRRELRAQMNERYKTHVMLLAILAQKGGEVTITEGTLAQVVGSLRQLSYTINVGEVKGESVVRLMTKETNDQEAGTADSSNAGQLDDTTHAVSDVESSNQAASITDEIAELSARMVTGQV